MSRRLVSLTLLLVFLCLLAAAQRPIPQRTVDLRVSLWAEDGHKRIEDRVLVELLNGSYNFVAETFTNDEGQAVFGSLPAGTYHLKVSGKGIEDTTTGSFTLEADEGEHYENIEVKTTTTAGENSAGPPGAGQMVALVDLNVPGKAKKEFDKGIACLNQNDLPEAKKHFEKAVQIYPQYAGAYNNLGIVAIKSRDLQTARSDFQQAVQINDHYATAYTNLARLSLADRKYPQAEQELGKALGSAPLDPAILTLMCRVQLLNGENDQAIATATKVHSSPHKDFAMVHVYAGIAFQRESRSKEAADEYATYLKEAPSGQFAPQVQAELTKLQQVQHQGP